MHVTSYDVIVVGAGPAGSTVARGLTQAGVRVLLLEKARLPRYKTCGGGISVKTRQLLDFDIEPAVECTIHGVAITDRLRPRFEREADVPLAYMVMRDRFDHL